MAYLKISQCWASSPCECCPSLQFPYVYRHSPTSPQDTHPPAPDYSHLPYPIPTWHPTATPLIQHHAVHLLLTPPSLCCTIGLCWGTRPVHVKLALQYICQTINSMSIFQDSCLHTVAGWQATVVTHMISLHQLSKEHMLSISCCARLPASCI